MCQVLPYLDRGVLTWTHPLSLMCIWWNAKVVRMSRGRVVVDQLRAACCHVCILWGRSTSVFAVLSLTAHEATVTGPEGVKAHWCRHAVGKIGLGQACSAALKSGGTDV